METKQHEYQLLAEVQRANNWAIYLPALQPQQVIQFSKLINSQNGRGKLKELDWLRFMDDEHPRALEYDWALYSAANGYKKSYADQNFIMQRSPKSLLFGDSGGYQIATGNLQANWLDPDDKKASHYREKIKKWLCVSTDYAMCLDIPVHSLMKEGTSAKTGCYTFDDCLNATLINNDHFVQPCTHPYAKTKFLNVLQGTNSADAMIWYEAVKKYCDPSKYVAPFRGWAIAGTAKDDLRITMQLISVIIDDKLLLEGTHDWIHFLGIGTLTRATVYSYIQQSLRKHHNPNISVSFDTSGTSRQVRSSQQSTDPRLEIESKWTFGKVNSVAGSKYTADSRNLDQIIEDDQQPLIFSKTLLGDRLTGADMCVESATLDNKWDDVSYFYQTVNQLSETLYAYQDANREADKGNFPIDQHWAGTNAKAAIEDVLSKKTHRERLHRIDHYQDLWDQLRA